MPRVRWYLYTPTLEYLAYRAYANARAYPCNGVGTRLVITMRRVSENVKTKEIYSRDKERVIRDFIHVGKQSVYIKKLRRSSFYNFSSLSASL